jgi:phenylacetate-CoA ligase
MNTDRPYWDMEIEPLFNAPDMGKIQLDKLKKILGRLNANAPFYTRQFKEIGLNPEKISSFDEYREKVPMFDKAALRELVAECGNDILKALDHIMPVSVTDLDYIATTTGTTGVPTPYPLTLNDIHNVWGEVLARGAWRAGIRSHDSILYCFALSMVIAGVPSMMAIQKMGATMLPVGAEAKSERILLMQKLFGGTVYMGTPSLAEYLIEQAPKLIGKQASELGFKALICGAEPGAGIPEVKNKLEQAYGCRIFDVGAGFGFSCDHEEYQGMHWMGDDLCYYELVDPDTKALLPMENGAKGEAVFTHLEGDGWVMVRQSLGDIHQVFTEPCPCGRSGFRYKVIGRADDMLKVKGVMVYPSNIKGVINEFVPRLTGEMRIVLDEKPPRVVPPLKIRVEHAEGIAGEHLETLEGELVEAMSRRLKIKPFIIWTEPGSLERSHYKGQTFEKKYEET